MNFKPRKSKVILSGICALVAGIIAAYSSFFHQEEPIVLYDDGIISSVASVDPSLSYLLEKALINSIIVSIITASVIYLTWSLFTKKK